MISAHKIERYALIRPQRPPTMEPRILAPVFMLILSNQGFFFMSCPPLHYARAENLCVFDH